MINDLKLLSRDHPDRIHLCHVKDVHLYTLFIKMTCGNLHLATTCVRKKFNQEITLVYFFFFKTHAYTSIFNTLLMIFRNDHSVNSYSWETDEYLDRFLLSFVVEKLYCIIFRKFMDILMVTG